MNYGNIKVLSNEELIIYGDISKSGNVTKLLFEHGLSVAMVSQQNDDLENYYINLIGGQRND